MLKQSLSALAVVTLLAACASISGKPEATATLAARSGSMVAGTVSFTEVSDGLKIRATITGLKPGAHGFHIHEAGDCSAPDASSAKGFSFTPAVTMATQVAGFGSTIFLVLAKHTGDDTGLATYKNNSPVGGNVMIYHPLPTFTHSTYGRKIALSSVNTDTYDAAKTSNISIYGDGLRHTGALH